MINQLFDQIHDLISASDAFADSKSKQKFIGLLKQCHRINYSLSDDTKINIGKSKVGGLPDLPPDLDWPMYDGHYLTFLCQLNLIEIDNTQLGNKGIIYFFVYADPENSYVGKKGSFRIIFNRDPGILNRINYPKSLDLRSRFQPSVMHFFESISYPSGRSRLVKDFFKGFNQEKAFYEKFDHLLEAFHRQPIPKDKICGYDDPLQQTVEGFWAINYLGLNTWEEVDQNALEVEYLRWQFELLLQLDLSLNPSRLASYGGAPIVYFGIFKEDLEQKLLENAVLTFQDT